MRARGVVGLVGHGNGMVGVCGHVCETVDLGGHEGGSSSAKYEVQVLPRVTSGLSCSPERNGVAKDGTIPMCHAVRGVT